MARYVGVKYPKWGTIQVVKWGVLGCLQITRSEFNRIKEVGLDVAPPKKQQAA